MFQLFQSPTADGLWRQVASVLEGGAAHEQASRIGTTREILHASLCVEDPRQRWVCSRQPALNVAFALAEVVWMVRGRNDAAFLNYFNTKLAYYAGDGATYHGAYGERLRAAFGFDQLERAYQALTNNPDNRQTILQFWDPRQDFPNSLGRAVAADIPCNVSALLKVRNQRLEWVQIMRSNDLHLGLPHNLVQFTCLQEILAGWLGLEPAAYHHFSDSLHLYEKDVGKFQMSTVAPTLATNTERLSLPKAESDRAFTALETAIECIITPSASFKVVALLAEAEAELPTAFGNWLRVFCAEAVRRRGETNLARDLIAGCTSETLRQLYAAWLGRVTRTSSS